MNGFHATARDWPESARGVLASSGDVTPARRSEDLTRSKITLRDAIVAALAIAGMWGLQVATQERAAARTQASIETLSTKFDGYVQKQTEANAEFQRQLDEVRKQANLGVAYGIEAKTEAARLGGIMTGTGIFKGAAK
jgi:hypothetical protein